MVVVTIQENTQRTKSAKSIFLQMSGKGKGEGKGEGKRKGKAKRKRKGKRKEKNDGPSALMILSQTQVMKTTWTHFKDLLNKSPQSCLDFVTVHATKSTQSSITDITDTERCSSNNCVDVLGGASITQTNELGQHFVSLD